MGLELLALPVACLFFGVGVVSQENRRGHRALVDSVSKG